MLSLATQLLQIWSYRNHEQSPWIENRLRPRARSLCDFQNCILLGTSRHSALTAHLDPQVGGDANDDP